ncbi:type VI secretion system baseplate subunit TssK [uncultured Xylophilus sp.]|uniref:type VI secretion system baseplate subunit TssK n=1 Tax=uncultured Xylophilus sp. TaxID=296832 RepID=UPI0025FB4F65|nr:type VI secretion system baseplate subunit TssK [uncultured Xylophilus sp.]
MSRPNPVADRIQWHEGMLLSPQHFQLLSARLDGLVAWQTLAAAPFAWGVRRWVVDTGLLPAGLLRVLELDAILPDGTAVVHSAGDPLHQPLELSLAPFAEQLAAEPLDVYLTLPVATAARTAEARYRSVSGAPVEDEVSDALPADIPRLLPRLGLAVGAVPSGLYVALRLGTLSKDNEVVKLGTTLPPLLEVARDNPLWVTVSALLGQLRGKAAFVAKQTAMPSSRVDDRLAQLELKDRLRSLLAELPFCEAVMRTPHLHPLPLYWALCGLLGSLSLLRPGGLPPVPPDYDHADPSRIFAPVIAALQDAVSDVSQDYREHKFEFRNGAFEIELRPEWMGARLVVGARGQPDKDLLAWMGSAIIGSHSAYPSLRERRVLGAVRSPIDHADELGLRTGSGYLLEAIQVSPGLTVAGERLIISNTNESATAQRPQELVLFTRE